jgi:hypothetical protein
MRVEILVEEQSAEEALGNIVPMVLGAEADYQIHRYNGKAAMLKRLPNRLRGYSSWIQTNPMRLLVLMDRDDDDCKQLKDRLEQMANQANLATKTNPQQGGFHLVNRVIIEELEAWFFGDLIALRSAYPKVGPYLTAKAQYRDPDNIQGGTWEALERVLQNAGYYPSGLPKIEVARKISAHMVPARNTSQSFACFIDGLHAAAGI